MKDRVTMSDCRLNTSHRGIAIVVNLGAIIEWGFEMEGDFALTDADQIGIFVTRTTWNVHDEESCQLARSASHRMPWRIAAISCWSPTTRST